MGKISTPMFIGIIVLICIVSGVLAYGIEYYNDSNFKTNDLSGYKFNIPGDLQLNNSYSDNKSFNNIYWAKDSSYSIMISVGENVSSEEVESLILNNSNVNYEKTTIKGKDAYFVKNFSTMEYYVLVNNDCIYLGLWNVNDHKKLAEKILKYV